MVKKVYKTYTGPKYYPADVTNLSAFVKSKEWGELRAMTNKQLEDLHGMGRYHTREFNAAIGKAALIVLNQRRSIQDSVDKKAAAKEARRYRRMVVDNLRKRKATKSRGSGRLKSFLKMVDEKKQQAIWDDDANKVRMMMLNGGYEDVGASSRNHRAYVDVGAGIR